MPSYADLRAGYLRSLTAERRASAYTVRNYTAAIERLEAFVRAHTGEAVSVCALSGLTTRDYRAFLADRRRDGVEPATVRLDLSGVRSFLRYLNRHAGVPLEAISALRTPKAAKRLPRPVGQAEAAALSRPPADPQDWTEARDAALFALLYGAGLRISEALALDAGACDGRAVRVLGKGGKSRDVPVLAAVHRTVASYERMLEADPKARLFRTKLDPAPLFLGAKGGRLAAAVAQRRLRAQRALLGLADDATPHALRHAFATHMLAGGADLRVIQELMGHASLSSTQVYTQVDSGRLLSIHAGAHPRARRAG